MIGFCYKNSFCERSEQKGVRWFIFAGKDRKNEPLILVTYVSEANNCAELIFIRKPYDE
jgi:hypothetical protein